MIVFTVYDNRTEIGGILEGRVIKSRLEDESAVQVELFPRDADIGLQNEVITDQLKVGWFYIYRSIGITCSHDRLADLDGEHLHLDIDDLAVVDLYLYFFVLTGIEDEIGITRYCA